VTLNIHLLTTTQVMSTNRFHDAVANFPIDDENSRAHPKPHHPVRASPVSGMKTRGRTHMGLFTYDIQSFNDLFVHTLRDIYYAENQILKALPKMIDKATNPELRSGFQSHLRETEVHVSRLEKVFQMHGIEASGVDCPAIDGIIKESNEIASEVADKEVLDAALAAAAQAVEHYEMTRYGTLIAWSKRLGRADIAAILKQTLDEEKAADQKLSSIADKTLNLRATA